MYFDEEEDRYINPDLLLRVGRELFADALGSSVDVTSFDVRNMPTHTEDGIPIRKLYVSNLPPKTTRKELFGLFAQYGFIKSCWLKIAEKGPNRSTPTYAFVTYSNPSDAHKALQGTTQELTLRDRLLKISPADSWHQPIEDADGRILWKPQIHRRDPNTDLNAVATPSGQNAVAGTATSTSSDDAARSAENPEQKDEETSESEQNYTILDILNRDCLTQILEYVSVRDLILSERVSKAWRNLIQEYLQGIRTFKTSSWQDVPVTLTTAVLRRMLQRIGGSLTRLHIDHHWSSLNDRTAHTVGKFCPNLEELKVVGMLTKNWNPLIYGCKHLKSITFISCNKLTDSSLVHLVKHDSGIESLTIANNTHVTGLFLNRPKPLVLHTLAFYNCYSLQATILSTAIACLPNLTTLRLDVCPLSVWKVIPSILTKLPKLQELSLSDYAAMEMTTTTNVSDDFLESFSKLTELRTLILNRNVCVTNAVLKQIGQTCHKLEILNIEGCNPRKNTPFTGVSDEGVAAVCRGCSLLLHIDVSYLAELTDAGVASIARCSRLQVLLARGNSGITAEPFARCLSACQLLEVIDVCGCEDVSEDLILSAVQEIEANPRTLILRVGGTLAAAMQDPPSHKLLTLNLTEDYSNPHFRPDFLDRFFESGSEDSFDDIYDQEDFDEYIGPGEFFADEDDYDGLYAFALHDPDMILF